MKNRIPTYSFTNINGEEVLAEIFLWNNDFKYNFEEPHSHSFNELFIFEKGGGKHFMSDFIHEVQDFTIHFLPSHAIHQMNRTVDSKGFTIAFSDVFLNQLQKFEMKINYSVYFSKAFCLNLDEPSFNEFTFYFEELFNSKNDKTYFLNLISLILLKIIKINKFNCIESNNFSFESKIMHLINENYKQKPKLDFYSKKLKISTTTLNRKVKACFGKSISDIQNIKIIEEAKYLLAINELSIKQIAYSLNFNNEGHFTVFFKQYVGLCPKEFKKGINVKANG